MHVHLIPNICKGMCADRWVSNEQVCYKTKRRMLPVWSEILKCKSSEETLVSGSRLMNWLRNLHVGRWAVNSKNTATYNFTAQCCSHCLKASYFVEVKRKTAVASSLNMGREVNSSCCLRAWYPELRRRRRTIVCFPPNCKELWISHFICPNAAFQHDTVHITSSSVDIAKQCSDASRGFAYFGIPTSVSIIWLVRLWHYGMIIWWYSMVWCGEMVWYDVVAL